MGTYALGGAYGSSDSEASKKILRRAYELGINFFDSAEAYGPAEEILGEVLKPHRDKVHIATKVGVRESSVPNLSREYVTLACEESLRRLQTDYIDLYQVHFDDPKTPVEETLGALEELVRAGKIRHYGLGHLPTEKVKSYFEAGHVFSVLMELSAVSRLGLRELLPYCREHGCAAIAFSVTGRGLLTSAVQPETQFARDDIRSIDPLFQRENFHSGLRIASELAKVGEAYGKTPAQVAVAWVLAQPGLLCALTGPSSVSHLEENIGGSGWQISPEDLARLESFLRHEDARLQSERESTLRGILLGTLPMEPSQAFSDLLYAAETAVTQGLVRESDVLPPLRELLALRKGLSEGGLRELEDIQRKLRDIIPLDPGSSGDP